MLKNESTRSFLRYESCSRRLPLIVSIKLPPRPIDNLSDTLTRIRFDSTNKSCARCSDIVTIDRGRLTYRRRFVREMWSMLDVPTRLRRSFFLPRFCRAIIHGDGFPLTRIRDPRECIRLCEPHSLRLR